MGREPLYPHVPKIRKGDLSDEVKFKVGDRVSAPKVPVKGTIKAKGVSPFTVQVRWDDGEWGWCDVRDLTPASNEEESTPKKVEELYPYHGIAYDYEGHILESDDFKTPPSLDIIATWADFLAKREFGEAGGLKKKMPVDKIIITGPKGYQKKWTTMEIISAVS